MSFCIGRGRNLSHNVLCGRNTLFHSMTFPTCTAAQRTKLNSTYLVRHDVPGATFAVLLRSVLVQIVGIRERGAVGRTTAAAAAAAVRVDGAARHGGRTRRGQWRRCEATGIIGGGHDLQSIARTNTLVEREMNG